MNERDSRTWRLSISREQRDGVLLLAVTGRLSAASSADLTQELSAAIDQRERRLVLDLAGVDYISSAGLIALEAVAARLRSEAGTLVLCGLSEPVRLAFDLAGSLPDFLVEASSAAAVERLASS